MNSYSEYMDLLSCTYEEAVDHLLKKHGPASDDYFRGASYERFMKGEIKNITRGKISRTDEGLYCHHMDEIKWLKISDQSFVKKFNIPFEYQRKNRLVYCDLVEHTVLHVLITTETSFEYGFPGYEVYLKGLMEEWYLAEIKPNRAWMKNCYDKSFLEPQEAFNLLKEVQKTLGLSYFNTLEEYYSDRKKLEVNNNKQQEKVMRRCIEDRNHWIECAKQLDYKSSRLEIVTASYYIRIYYKNIKGRLIRSITFEEYDSSMNQYSKEKILDELLLYIEEFDSVEK